MVADFDEIIGKARQAGAGGQSEPRPRVPGGGTGYGDG